MVLNAHRRMDFSDCAGNTCDIEIGAMHPNISNSLPNAHNTKNNTVIDRHSKEHRPVIKNYEFPFNRS
jgi:hypothetical protein